jgi:hypothetical protein
MPHFGGSERGKCIKELSKPGRTKMKGTSNFKEKSPWGVLEAGFPAIDFIVSQYDRAGLTK